MGFIIKSEEPNENENAQNMNGVPTSFTLCKCHVYQAGLIVILSARP